MSSLRSKLMEEDLHLQHHIGWIMQMTHAQVHANQTTHTRSARTHAHAHAHTHTRKRCEIAVPHRFNRGGNLAINFLTFLTSVFRSTHRRPLSLSLSHIRTQTNICCWLVSLPRCRLLEAK